jgi:4'-phosphopantetheinyl transferase
VSDGLARLAGSAEVPAGGELHDHRVTGATMDDVFGLERHDVHLWSLQLDLSPTARVALERVLSEGEVARMRRFVFAADRRRYAAARGLLRVVLSGYLGVGPEAVPLEASAGGKPMVAGRERPRFSLSHAGARGLIAVTADQDVGVDIEEVRDVGDLLTLAGTCFSPVERSALAAVPASQRQRAFFSGWTRKEAFLKVLGEGLSRPLDTFDVTLAPGAPARLLRVHGALRAPARYALRDLEPAAGCVGALAVDGPVRMVTWRSWQTLSALLGEPVTPCVEAGSGLHPLVGESAS